MNDLDKNFWFVVYIDIPDTKGHKLYYVEHNIINHSIDFSTNKEIGYRIYTREFAIKFAEHLNSIYDEFNFFVEKLGEC